MTDRDTIFALSSGALPAGVAVVRMTGPGARAAVEAVAGALPEARRAVLRVLRDEAGEPIDTGLVIWLPGPASFTGEDMAEFQVHGGRAVVAALVARLGRLDGARAAEAGEFSRRAFLNGRLDLTEIEGLADLIGAETEWQRRQAVRQAGGALRMLYDGWRADLIRIRALIEAELDFPDEEDVPGAVSDRVWGEAERLADAMGRHLADGGRGERLRRGFEVVLMGPPNAGKSSLLNAIARRDVAIVTAEPGTTRDLVEVHLDLDGFPVTLVDSAGLRETEGIVEQEGIRRAIARGRSADLVLWLVPRDAGAGATRVPSVLDGVPVLPVTTKADLAGSGAGAAAVGGGGVAVSAVTGAGLAALEKALADRAGSGLRIGDEPIMTRSRHREALSAAKAALDRALGAPRLPLELRAEELRRAADSLGRITGRIDVEDLLDVVFREFCIGK